MAKLRAFLTTPDAQKVLQHFGGTAAEVFGTVEVNGRSLIASKIDGNTVPCLLVDALQHEELQQNLSNRTAVDDLVNPDRRFHCIIGPSGVGKSSTVLQALTKRWGIYMEAFVGGQLSSTLMLAMHDQLARCKNDREASKDCFKAMHLTFLLTLEAFQKTVSGCTPAQWMHLMLTASNKQFQHHAAIAAVMRKVFLTVNAEPSVLTWVPDLAAQLECHIVFVDEAQQFLNTVLYGTYASINRTAGRPVLSMLFEAISGVVVSGTGMGMRDTLETAGSSAGKPGHATMTPLKGGGDAGDPARVRRRLNLARPRMLTLPGNNLQDVKVFLQHYAVDVPEKCRSVLGYLTGRSRVVANVVLNTLAPRQAKDSAGTWAPIRGFARVVERTVDDFATDLANNMVRHLRDVVCVGSATGAAELYHKVVKGLLVDAMWNDGQVSGAETAAVLTCIDLSICMLKRDEGDGSVVPHVDEEVAIRALLKVCHRQSWNPALEDLTNSMRHPLTSASEAGFHMEPLLAVDVFMRVLDPSCDATVREVLLGRFGDQGFTAYPRWTHPLRCKIFDLREKGRCNRFATLGHFLQAAADGALDHEQGPVFCLPDTAARPDLVTLLRNEQRQWLLCLLQSKRLQTPLGGNAWTRAVSTTDWNELYPSTKGEVSDFPVDDARAGASVDGGGGGGGTTSTVARINVRELCRDLLDAGKRCLRIVCSTSGVTGPIQDALPTLKAELSKTNQELVLLDRNALKKVMTPAVLAVAFAQRGGIGGGAAADEGGEAAGGRGGGGLSLIHI